MTIKITIEVDSENEQQFEELQRHIRNMTRSVCERYPKVTHHVSESFVKEGREVAGYPKGGYFKEAPAVKPDRCWPLLPAIMFPSRAEAESALDAMRYILRRQGYVTVADVLAETGKSSELVDTKYGWTNLVTAQFRGGRNGTQLWLPTPQALPQKTRPYSGGTVNRRQPIESIVLSTGDEAAEVLKVLWDMGKTFGSVSVGDLYNVVGVESAHTDHKWGWKFLSAANSSIKLTDEGYEIVLPTPILL